MSMFFVNQVYVTVVDMLYECDVWKIGEVT